MANQELINYILQYKNQFSSSQLREALLQQGQNPREVDEALQAAMSQQQPSFSPPPLPAASSAGSSGPGQGLNPSTLFTFDQQTKETMMHSAIGLLIANVIIFFGDILIGTKGFSSIIWIILFSAIGGAISGFLLSKLYYPMMDFVSQSLRFLLPLCNTFFKLLFVPVLIGSIISMLFSFMIGGLVFAAGAALGGAAGGLIGGILGGSLVLISLVSIVFMIIGRFIYAKYMKMQVGKYYQDYKNL